MSHDVHGPDWIEYRWRHENPSAVLFFFLSKLKAGDIMNAGQYMKYQTFSYLRFRQLLENSFKSFHIVLSNTSDEKILFVFIGITRPVWIFKSNLQPSFLTWKTLEDGCFKTGRDSTL